MAAVLTSLLPTNSAVVLGRYTHHGDTLCECFPQSTVPQPSRTTFSSRDYVTQSAVDGQSGSAAVPTITMTVIYDFMEGGDGDPVKDSSANWQKAYTRLVSCEDSVRALYAQRCNADACRRKHASTASVGALTGACSCLLI